MKMARLFYDLEDEVATYAIANWGNERPGDLDEFLRRIWSKYSNATPF